ncbi:MAG: hypothetical protein PHE06_14275 [Lachnospiraceae bacterium]|nr:hypothetical protein [Lachnospiraceae bacterium]
MFRKKQLSIMLMSMMLAAGSTGMAAIAADVTEAQTGKETAVQAFAGGSGTKEDPWQIADADQLLAIENQLDGYYVLTADIDFDGKTIQPIGAMVPLGTEGEDAETPNPDYAFSGVLDGGGYTISNYDIDASDDTYGAGLFACVTGENATITNLNVENVTLSNGGQLAGGLIGYQDAPVSKLNMSGTNKVSGEGLVGGLIGGSKADITDCSAVADVVMDAENAQGAGILVGGDEGGSMENCTVSGGSVTAEKKGAFSVGGLTGCFQESAYAKNCSVSDVTVTVGENAMMIGALSGHAGTAQGDPTQIENCSVKDVKVIVGENSERIGGISGSGFYVSAYAEYYPEPCAMAIKDCTVSGLTITGGKQAGSVLGYAYNNSTVENCKAEAVWNDAALEDQIGADDSVPLTDLF